MREDSQGIGVDLVALGDLGRGFERTRDFDHRFERERLHLLKNLGFPGARDNLDRAGLVAQAQKGNLALVPERMDEAGDGDNLADMAPQFFDLLTFHTPLLFVMVRLIVAQKKMARPSL